MITAKLYLHQLIQDSQDFGSDDAHMVSRVFFDLEIGDKKIEGLYANIKQPVGGSFESSPLEVSRPVNYTGPFNHDVFRNIVENYYRNLIGAAVSGMLTGGPSNIRMRNNTFVRPLTAEFEVQVAGGSW
ncbi:MAG: hypothetical protein Q7S51_04710 [Gallionellaceae bacterium]|nr:hypothetical protein [Gallionellaceae bacterium]